MVASVRLEGRELIATYEVIVPNAMKCEVDLYIGPEYTKNPTTLRMTIAFENKGDGQNVSFIPVGNRSLMTLQNWNSSMGTVLNSLFSFAKINDEGTVELMMANYAVGGVNQLTLQFWWSATK
ncbi:hypothetical protein HBO15_25355 [Pseudomonas sp. WS 5111]|uniref:hypothetical protein n=1 Tax=unclassified Pseudomonas TaxID=196821 RepID=UPI001475B90A|nr:MULTISPECIES: hypothetical protein [unclassified Pseudomonas]NMX70690.1 hypothetical protein [Pseudomonas sp. WS 5111]NMX84889.1 hypothetical protein [Pseudomonas sp. WS 5010]